MIYIKKDGALVHENSRLDGCELCGGWQAESPAHLCPSCFIAFVKVAEKLFEADVKACNRLADLIEQLSMEDCKNLEQGVMPVSPLTLGEL